MTDWDCHVALLLDPDKIKNSEPRAVPYEGVSRLAERGKLSLLEIASMSGHKTLQKVLRYSHLQAKKLDEPVFTSHHRSEQETGVESSP